MGKTVSAPKDWSDRKGVEAWLRTQPREIRLAVAIRSTLRVIPLIDDSHFDLEEVDGPKTYSPLLAAFWIAAFQLISLQNAEISKVRHTIWNYVSGNNDFDIDTLFSEIREAESPAHGAFGGVLLSLAAIDRLEKVEEIYSHQKDVYFIDDPELVNFQKDLQSSFLADVQEIFKNGDRLRLIGLPLWHHGIHGAVRARVNHLRSRLLASREGWEVWTTWYDARLRGDPLDVDLETRRVIEPTRWDEGPAAVNAEIAAIIADHRASLAQRLVQDRRGAIFIERDGRLAIAPGDAAVDARANAMQPRTVEVLQALTDATRSSNQFGALGKTAKRLADLVALPPEEAAAQSFELWSLSRDLAHWRIRDNEAKARDDGFVDAMPATLRQALDTAVPATALYARSFPDVRNYDDELADYEGQIASPATQRAILAAAMSADAVEKADATTINIVINVGGESGPHAERAAKGGWFTTRNMVVGASLIVANYFALPYASETVAGLARSHEATARLERFLNTAGDAIDDLMRSAPDDLRQAVEAVRAWLASRT